MAKLYLDITKKYYGHDQGVCIVDDYIAHEWSGVPHFYNSYYVFQYATSFTAATALSEGVLTAGVRGADATKRYIQFLSSGGSKHPIDLLKDAGVDMTTDQPLELTVQEDESGDGRDREDAELRIGESKSLEWLSRESGSRRVWESGLESGRLSVAQGFSPAARRVRL